MKTEFSHAELAKADWEELVAQCISACLQGDLDRAERIRWNDTQAKIAQASPFLRAETEAEAYPYIKRMEEVLDSFFPA